MSAEYAAGRIRSEEHKSSSGYGSYLSSIPATRHKSIPIVTDAAIDGR